MTSLFFILLVLFALSPGPIVAGRRYAVVENGHLRGLLSLLFFVLFLGLVSYSIHADRSGVGSALAGAALVAVLVGAIPVFLYFEVGYRWHTNPRRLTGIWLFTVAPIAAYMIVALLLIAQNTTCPTNGSDCPI